MFGLPKDFPYENIMGRELMQISLGPNDLFLNFTDGVSVQVESAIEIECNGKSRRYSDFGDAVSDMSNFISESILKASTLNGNDLNLLFTNGCVIKIIDDSVEYESYVVVVGSRKIVV